MSASFWNRECELALQKDFAESSFEPSDVARQNEALNGNTRSEDVIQIIRKRVGPNGTYTLLEHS